MSKDLKKAMAELYTAPKNATMRGLLKKRVEDAVEKALQGEPLPEEFASLGPYLTQPKPKAVPRPAGRLNLESFIASDGTAHMSHDEGTFIVTLEKNVEVSAIGPNLNDAIERALEKFGKKVG